MLTRIRRVIHACPLLYRAVRERDTKLARAWFADFHGTVWGA